MPKQILSLGAGVQSSTLLLMSCLGELPKLDAAIFADVGWEPKAVYEYLEFLKEMCAKHSIPLHILNNGNIRQNVLDAAEGRGTRFASIPLYTLSKSGKKGMIRRQCTSEYKIIPITKKIREICDVLPRKRPKDILCREWFGIGYDETQRMRISKTAWIENYYPLVDMKMGRQQSLEWHQRHGFPVPPRSSCIGCPFHGAAEWNKISKVPEEWADAVEFDERIRNGVRFKNDLKGTVYIHSSCKPLKDVDPRSDVEKGQMLLDGFNNECSGHCGV